MTVTTRNPTSVISSGTWTNVANVYASDTARAALTVSSGNSPFVVSGFDLVTPVGTDTINSVAVTVQHYENQTTQLSLTVELLNSSGVLIGSSQTLTARTTEGTQTLTFPAITTAQLNGLRIRVTGAKSGGSGSRTFNVNHVQVAIDHNPPPTDPPTDLAATPNSSSQITLTWTKPAAADTVDVERDGVVTTNVTSPLQHTGLGANTTHNYRVRSVNVAGAGAWSSIVQATTWPAPPAPPSDLAATVVDHQRIDVTWTVPGGTTSVDLEVDGVVQTGETSPYVHGGLNSNTLHDYRVRGNNISGPGSWSSIVSATTDPPPPLPRVSDAGSPSDVPTITYSADGPSASYDQTMDGGGPVEEAAYTIRVNGVTRTIAKFRMNGVDRTVSAFRINGANL